MISDLRQNQTAISYCYVDDVTVLVTSNAKIDKVGREIREYETVEGTTIYCDK